MYTLWQHCTNVSESILCKGTKFFLDTQTYSRIYGSLSAYFGIFNFYKLVTWIKFCTFAYSINYVKSYAHG